MHVLLFGGLSEPGILIAAFAFSARHANQLLTHLARCLLKSSETLDLLARLLETASRCSRPLNRNELLHAAAMAGNREVCEILVNNGHPICVKERVELKAHNSRVGPVGNTSEQRATAI